MQEARREAVTQLRALHDSRSVEALIQYVQCITSSHRRYENKVENAILTLGELGDRRAIPLLLGLLLHHENCVRTSAASSLAQLGEQQWQQWIKGIGRADDVARIGLSKDARMYELLINASDRGQWWPAVHALGDLGDTRALDLLVKLWLPYSPTVRDGYSPDVRSEAAEALGKLGDKRAVETLAKMLSDKKVEVCKAAAEALDKFGDPRGTEALRKIANASQIDGQPQGMTEVQIMEKAMDQICSRKLKDAVETLSKSKNQECLGFAQEIERQLSLGPNSNTLDYIALGAIVQVLQTRVIAENQD